MAVQRKGLVVNNFKVVGKVVKIESLASSVVKGASVIQVEVQIDSVDFGEDFNDLNEFELSKVITFEFFKHKHFHFSQDLQKTKLIEIEDESQRSRELEEQVQSWTTGLRVDDTIEFKATHINNLGILDIQPHMFYKNLDHYQPYTIHSEYRKGWGIPRLIENKDKNDDVDSINEHVGQKQSWIKRIIPFFKRLFIEIIWNSLVSVWKWIFSFFSNPS